MLHNCKIVLCKYLMSAWWASVLFLSLPTTALPQENGGSPPSISGSDYAANIAQSRLTRVKTPMETAAPARTTTGPDSPPRMTVIIMNDARQFNLALKVGDQFIELPGPTLWPNDAGDGTSNTGKARFLAALVDTSAILKANGFKPDTPFNFVVNGAEMNDNNTHHIAAEKSVAGNRSPGDTRKGDMLAVGNRAWRGYKFRNIVVSRGRIPSLSDYLVPSENRATRVSTKNYSPDIHDSQNSTFTPRYYRGDVPQVTPLTEASPQANHKYIEALKSPDPAVRADAIENLIINGYDAPDVIQGADSPGASVGKSASGNTSATSDKYLDSPNLLDDSLPQDALSGIALHDKNPSVRIQALDQLAERFGQQASSTLKEAVHDPDPRVARLADALMLDLQDQEQ
jgi:hypothetical protein